MDLVELVYKQTIDFPPNEKFRLTSQIRRAAVSIPSNIAEGYFRMSKKDFRRFILISYGSSAELETQIELATRLGYMEDNELVERIQEIQKMLNSFSLKLKSDSLTS